MQQHLARLHKAGIYSVVLIAFLCALLGGGVGPLTGGLFVVSLVASWLLNGRNPTERAPSRGWNILILATIAFTAFRLIATAEPIIVAAIRFVLVLMAVKLFSRVRTRDDLQLYALTLLIFAASTALSQDIVYGLLFGLYVIAGTFSLALFHLNAEVNPDPPGARQVQTSDASRSPFDARYMMVLGGISMVIFASSLAIFFAFPRVGLGFFVHKSRDAMSVTGFSDSVQLGSHGAIRDNPQVVMRVEFPDERPDNYQSLHWRTMTFDHYDGATWSRTIEDSEESLSRVKGGYQFAPLVGDMWRPANTEALQQVDIYLEPIGVNLLPRLWPTGNVRYGNNALMVRWNPLRGGFTIDAYNDLRHTLESEVGVAYSFEQLAMPSARELRDAPYDAAAPQPDAQYLQLPELSADFLRLAGQISAGAETPYAKAEAVVEYLGTGFGYTTDLPAVGGGEPIESFVFDTKRGHCEYFASTAVLMLRVQGVPARLVTGFLGGAWNSVGDYLGVRQGDAHAWVEVYVPRYGWVPIDPTPAADVLPVQRGALETWLRNTYDAARLNWMKWVIEYDLGAQIALVKKAARYFAPAQRSQVNRASKAGDTSGVGLQPARLLYAVFALVALGFLAWLGRRWLSRSPASKLRKIFARLERAGASAGVERRPDEGPGGYIDRLGDAFPRASAELSAFRQRYLSARFGGRPPGPTQLRGMRELVEKIRKKLSADS